MFERFTDRARRVVVLAHEEARLLRHNYIGTEHILLGLINEGEGVAAQALESLGVGLHAARAEVGEIVGVGKKAAPTGHIPFTPQSKKVLELSLREALQLGHNYIGTEHILLGLLREGDGVAVQVLVRLGVDLNDVRRTVNRVLHGEQGARSSERAGPEVPSVPLTGVAARRERSLLAGVRTQLMAIEARLAALEQRVGTGPDERASEAEIRRIRIATHAAEHAEDHARAAALRDKERALIEQQESARADWSAAHPSLAALAESVRQLAAQVERLTDSGGTGGTTGAEHVGTGAAGTGAAEPSENEDL